MRHLLIYIIGLSFFLGSCSREDMVDNSIPDEITIPPSKEVEVGDINGIVKGNNGELLSSAIVKLYNETELIAETNTNSFGEFDFIDVLEEDVYKIFVLKDSYYASIAFISEDHFDNEDVEIDLFLGTSVSPTGQPIDLLDPNYIILYGEITNVEGNPVNSNIFIITEDGNFFYQSAIKNGNYAALIPKNMEVLLQIYQTSGCPLFDEINLLGPYDSNTEINFQSEESMSNESVSGIVTVCDSTVLESGTLEFWSNDGNVIQVEIENGQFDFDFEGCDFEYINFQIYDEFNYLVYAGVFDGSDIFYQINLECNNILFETGTAELTYNNGQSVLALDVLAIKQSYSGQVLIFPISQEFDSNIFSLSFFDENSNSSIIEDLTVGINGVLYSLDPGIPAFVTYSIEENGSSSFFGEMNASLSATITDITGLSSLEVSMEINSPIIIE